MKYFFPDSQDTVDPSFDFETETRSIERVRQRDDKYAHEVFSTPAYDGLLVSKGVVDGISGSSGKYTLAQRHRLYRVGAREFFRTDSLPIIGDCGAFTYVREEYPPYSVEEVLAFYLDCGFDYGISVDHIILAYQPKFDDISSIQNEDIGDHLKRQEITLQLASEFLNIHRSQNLRFEPLGVAQGWSPKSYSVSVAALQDMGYKYIALGGMVPLKTIDILSCLEAIDEVRKCETKFHLLGVTRVESIPEFESYGVASFDSTSPLMQAFKDDRDNYYTLDRTYTAIRVPQVSANPQLLRKIKSGQVSQDTARELEKAALEGLKQFDADKYSLENTLDAVDEYDKFCDPRKNHREIYREVLTDRPWKNCSCDVCQRLGYQVILFRGAERNRRRGFHNVWTFYRRLQNVFGLLEDAEFSLI
ncbi:MAG: tRNA-guanine transglycosylase DpdA [Aridibacter sp.]